MIWPKEISFDGLDEKVSEWCKERGFIGHPPIDAQYYTGSENEEEAGAAKLCCKILEIIWLAQRGESDEKNSRKHAKNT